MKKRLLSILMLAAALVLALAACGGGQGGEDSAHPWKWTRQGEDIRLTLKNAPADGYVWTYSDAADGLITVTRTDDGSGEDAVFTLSGSGFSGGTVRFVCEREEEPHDAVFTLEMTLAVDKKGRLTVSASDYTQNPAGGTAGQDGKASTIWYVTDESLTEIYVTSGDWSVLGYDESLLRVSSPVYGENGSTYSLEGLDAGQTELYIYDMRADYGFKFTLTTGTDLTAAVTACEAGTFAFAADVTPGFDEAADIIGEIKMPAGFSVLRTLTGAWYGDGEDDYAEMRLRDSTAEWSLTVTKSYTRDELAALFVGNAAGVTKAETAVGETRAVLYGDESDFVLFWDDVAGRAFALSPVSDGVTQDALLAAAESIISAQN